MHILLPGMETRAWCFVDLTVAAPKLAPPAAEANLRRHETIWRFPTLLAQPGPIGTSGRIEDNDIVPCGCLFPLAGDWQVGGTLGRGGLPPCLETSLSRPLPQPPAAPIPRANPEQ